MPVPPLDEITSETPQGIADEITDAGIQRTLALCLRVGSALVEQFETPKDDCPLADRARGYEVVTRSLRQTVLLHRHLADERRASEDRRVQARKRIVRCVEDVIERDADPDHVPFLRRELLERLDMPDFALDLATRTPSELVAELVRDFNLHQFPGRPATLRRTPDDIAVLCAQAAAPAGSGLAQWAAAALPHATLNDATSLRPAPHDRR